MRARLILTAILAFLFLGWRLTAQQSKPAKSTVLYSDTQIRVIAVYHDNCTLCVTEPNTETLNTITPSAPVLAGDASRRDQTRPFSPKYLWPVNHPPSRT